MMTKTIVTMLLCAAVGCQGTEGGKEARKGAKWGAAGGAALGLALGAATGDAKFAAAGAAAGAASGAAAGAMYEYDQSRQDRRNKQLADAIGGAKKGETVDQAGKRHLDDFIGEWKLTIWALGQDGKRINATGRAKGVLESKTRMSLTFRDIKATGHDGVLTGKAIVTYTPEQGFALENTFAGGDTTKWVGEYVPQGNKYNFYVSQGEGGKTPTGIVRTNTRVELRVSGANLIVADTYTMVDGKETQIQSYRFMK